MPTATGLQRASTEATRRHPRQVPATAIRSATLGASRSKTSNKIRGGKSAKPSVWLDSSPPSPPAPPPLPLRPAGTDPDRETRLWVSTALQAAPETAETPAAPTMSLSRKAEYSSLSSKWVEESDDRRALVAWLWSLPPGPSPWAPTGVEPAPDWSACTRPSSALARLVSVPWRRGAPGAVAKVPPDEDPDDEAGGSGGAACGSINVAAVVCCGNWRKMISKI